jgi:hypothetical protein
MYLGCRHRPAVSARSYRLAERTGTHLEVARLVLAFVDSHLLRRLHVVVHLIVLVHGAIELDLRLLLGLLRLGKARRTHARS